MSSEDNLHMLAYACLQQTDVALKVADTFRLFQLEAEGQYTVQNCNKVRSIPEPGRPNKPSLIHQHEVPRRDLGNEQGRAAFIHAICHIEFNAINLALDAVYRFRDMPVSYYKDWLQVAKEEAEHFQLLSNRLNEMGCAYGDFPAHNGLWDMACRTEHDILHRMALVPRVLEARGLDVTPGIIHRLRQVGDLKTVEILELILREEIGHVKIGSHWYKVLCEQRELEPISTFRLLVREYYKSPLREPLNHQARIEAGFTEQEIWELTQPFR